MNFFKFDSQIVSMTWLEELDLLLLALLSGYLIAIDATKKYELYPNSIKISYSINSSSYNQERLYGRLDFPIKFLI